MYARFLGEAASIAGETRLRAMGAELTVIGDRWEQVAAAFAAAAQANNPADLLETADSEECRGQQDHGSPDRSNVARSSAGIRPDWVVVARCRGQA
jgi:hypothetical protein